MVVFVNQFGLNLPRASNKKKCRCKTYFFHGKLNWRAKHNAQHQTGFKNYTYFRGYCFKILTFFSGCFHSIIGKEYSMTFKNGTL